MIDSISFASLWHAPVQFEWKYCKSSQHQLRPPRRRLPKQLRQVQPQAQAQVQHPQHQPQQPAQLLPKQLQQHQLQQPVRVRHPQHPLQQPVQAIV
ncbi:unnamed protein product [Adineta steineri]|uniref:Uncharacterized protein n=1 Tax=Adineta steineri TaxID=433720 RepID=A0A815G2I6_9BILA|nr:unnamed protein product [Adineta steineri]